MPREQNCLGREGRRVLPGLGLLALRMLKQVGGVRPGICLDFGKPGCVLGRRGRKGTRLNRLNLYLDNVCFMWTASSGREHTRYSCKRISVCFRQLSGQKANSTQVSRKRKKKNLLIINS